MAITYQGAGTAIYGTTSLSMTSFPSGMAVGDLLTLWVGMKPSSANSGSVSTPSGWGLVGSLLSAGGYGATLGADTGNTHLYCFRRTVDGSETTFTVTGNTSDVMWGQILRHSSTLNGWKTFPFTNSDITAGNVSFTFSSVPIPGAGDYCVTAMCTPTDVGAGAQFSAEAFVSTGATFGTVVEISEPFTANGNDLGGLIAGAPISSGTGTFSSSFTATAGGTTTNVRGPGVMVLIRDVDAVAFDTLIDDFDDNSRDTAKWPSVSGSCTETNQRTELAPAASSSCFQNSVIRYNLTGATYFAKITPQAGTMTTAGLWMTLGSEYSNDVIYFGVNSKANTTSWKYLAGGISQTWLDAVGGGYNATNHQWVRLQESGGNLLFDTSPDGAVWTNQFSRAIPASFMLSSNDGDCYVSLLAERGTGTPSTNALVDSFNLGSGSNARPPMVISGCTVTRAATR